jgi:putative aminopeptidase FrvX
MLYGMPLTPIDMLKTVCSIPTAPFREHRVISFVEQFAARRRWLDLSRDASGNLLLIRPGKAKAKRRLIFVAHMDHPGLVVNRMTDDKTADCEFCGGVMTKFLPGTRVRFFSADREIRGRILSATGDTGGRATRASVRVNEPLAEGDFAMFDLTPARVSGRRFYSRVCDDLAGAAAALAMIDSLNKPAYVDVGVLLTRGEEEGFVGSLAAVIAPRLLRKSDLIVSIECSAEQPVARQGDGVVIRVGDRTSTFNSAFTRFISQIAQSAADEDKTFKFQRALMPGGTCEATVYDAWGYCAAATCVPLGNYHNMDKLRERIDAEYVHLDDWQNMVRLFTLLAKRAHQFDGTHSELKTRLGKLYTTHSGKLRLRGTIVSGA